MKTSRAILIELQKTLIDGYRAELEKLPMKKHVRDMLVDGFTDGARSGIQHTVKMLDIEVDETVTP